MAANFFTKTLYLKCRRLDINYSIEFSHSFGATVSRTDLVRVNMRIYEYNPKIGVLSNIIKLVSNYIFLHPKTTQYWFPASVKNNYIAALICFLLKWGKKHFCLDNTELCIFYKIQNYKAPRAYPWMYRMPLETFHFSLLLYINCAWQTIYCQYFTTNYIIYKLFWIYKYFLNVYLVRKCD